MNKSLKILVYITMFFIVIAVGCLAINKFHEIADKNLNIDIEKHVKR